MVMKMLIDIKKLLRKVEGLEDMEQGFMQNQIFASHTSFGGHVDVNC